MPCALTRAKARGAPSLIACANRMVRTASASVGQNTIDKMAGLVEIGGEPVNSI
jgi:hypothetical protein